MTFDYTSRLQRLQLNFSSSQLVSLRITLNDQVRITQCRNTMTMSLNVDVSKHNIITVENLTANVMVDIDSVVLGSLNITPAMFMFSTTVVKSTNEQIGDFIRDLGQPDLLTVEFDNTLYQKLLPLFLQKELVPLV